MLFISIEDLRIMRLPGRPEILSEFVTEMLDIRVYRYRVVALTDTGIYVERTIELAKVIAVKQNRRKSS